jgi:hypothetical protein
MISILNHFDWSSPHEDASFGITGSNLACNAHNGALAVPETVASSVSLYNSVLLDRTLLDNVLDCFSLESTRIRLDSMEYGQSELHLNPRQWCPCCRLIPKRLLACRGLLNSNPLVGLLVSMSRPTLHFEALEKGLFPLRYRVPNLA